MPPTAKTPQAPARPAEAITVPPQPKASPAPPKEAARPGPTDQWPVLPKQPLPLWPPEQPLPPLSQPGWTWPPLLPGSTGVTMETGEAGPPGTKRVSGKGLPQGVDGQTGHRPVPSAEGYAGAPGKPRLGQVGMGWSGAPPGGTVQKGLPARVLVPRDTARQASQSTSWLGTAGQAGTCPAMSWPSEVVCHPPREGTLGPRVWYAWALSVPLLPCAVVTVHRVPAGAASICEPGLDPGLLSPTLGATRVTGVLPGPGRVSFRGTQSRKFGVGPFLWQPGVLRIGAYRAAGPAASRWRMGTVG